MDSAAKLPIRLTGRIVRSGPYFGCPEAVLIQEPAVEAHERREERTSPEIAAFYQLLLSVD